MMLLNKSQITILHLSIIIKQIRNQILIKFQCFDCLNFNRYISLSISNRALKKMSNDIPSKFITSSSSKFTNISTSNKNNSQKKLTSIHQIPDDPDQILISPVYLPCKNCWQDSYDAQNTNMLYFLVFNQIPHRVTAITDRTIRKKTRKKIIKSCNNIYRIQRCNLMNYHLYHIKKNSSVRIPMLKQTLNMLKLFHYGPNWSDHSKNNEDIKHNDEPQMKRQISKSSFYSFFMERYIYKFLQSCQYCQHQKILKIPNRQDYFEDIYLHIEALEDNRLMMKPQAQDYGIDYSNIVFDPYTCFYDCRFDNYNPQLQSLLQYIQYNKLPPQTYHVTYQQQSLTTRLLQFKKKRIKIITCSRNTLHLWKTSIKNQLSKQGKIPMQKQKYILMKILHGVNGQHRSTNGMLEMLRKQMHYSFMDMKKIVEDCIGYWCVQCDIIKRNMNNNNNINNRHNRYNYDYDYHQQYDNINDNNHQYYQYNNNNSHHTQYLINQPLINNNIHINNNTNNSNTYKYQNKNNPIKYNYLQTNSNPNNHINYRQQQYYRNSYHNINIYQNNINNNYNKNSNNKHKHKSSEFINYANNKQIQQQNNQQQQKYLSLCKQQLLIVKNNNNNNIKIQPLLSNTDNCNYCNNQINYNYNQNNNSVKSLVNKIASKFNNNNNNIIQCIQVIANKNNVLKQQYIQVQQQYNDQQVGIIIINQQMINNYVCYGQSIKFNQYQQYIKQQQQQQWFIATILVQDNTTNYQIIGILILNKLSIINIYQSYYTYFTILFNNLKRYNNNNNINNNKLIPSIITLPNNQLYNIITTLLQYKLINFNKTQLIITSKQQLINQPLSKLIQHNHFMDIKQQLFTFIRKQYIDKYDIRKLMCRLKYMVIYQQQSNNKNIQNNTQNLQIIKKLQTNICKYLQCCLSQHCYIGLSGVEQSDKFNTKYRTIMDNMKRQQSIIHIISNLLALSLYNSEQQYQITYIQQLQSIQHMISPQIYKILRNKCLRQQQLSPQTILQKQISSSINIIPQQSIYCTITQKQYILTYLIQYQHWICSCNYIYYTGIPCQHLIAVIIKYRGDIGYYVSSRWINQNENNDKLGNNWKYNYNYENTSNYGKRRMRKRYL